MGMTGRIGCRRSRGGPHCRSVGAAGRRARGARQDGISSFPVLQAALSAGRDETLIFYVFDLLHLDGWDLRPCPLPDRKRVLAGLDGIDAA